MWVELPRLQRVAVNAQQAAEATDRYHFASPDEIVRQASADTNRVGEFRNSQPFGPLVGHTCVTRRRGIRLHHAADSQFLKFDFHCRQPETRSIEFGEEPMCSDER